MIKSKRPEYIAWYDMNRRCYNPNHRDYRNYGGRGIEVCDEWLNSPEIFINYMGKRPDGYSLDRIDNNDNYKPGNVRWADYSTQNLNKRLYSNNISGVRGITPSRYGWQVMARRDGKQVYVGRSKDIDEAIMLLKRWKAI